MIDITHILKYLKEKNYELYSKIILLDTIVEIKSS